MALSLDALNSRVAQLAQAKGGDIPLYTTDKPLVTALRKLLDNEATGLYMKRHLNLGASNEGTNLTGDGFDISPAGNRQVKSSYEVDYWDAFAPIQIPQKVIDEASDDSNGADEVISDYVGSMVETIWEDVEHWILTGSARAAAYLPVISTAARFSNLVTFNGAVTWTGHSGTTDRGLFELATQATQSGYVQGLAKSAIHSNQYGVGTGWAAGTTEQTLGQVFGRCRNFAGGVPIDMGFADSVTHAKMHAYLRQNVLVNNVGVDQESAYNYLVYKGAKIFDCSNLDTEDAAYSGTTASSSSAITGGVIYLLPTKRMEMRLAMTKAPEFKDISTNQAVLTAKLKMRMGLMTGRLMGLGAVAGTRIP